MVFVNVPPSHGRGYGVYTGIISMCCTVVLQVWIRFSVYGTFHKISTHVNLYIYYPIQIAIYSARFTLPMFYFQHFIPHHFSMCKCILVSCTSTVLMLRGYNTHWSLTLTHIFFSHFKFGVLLLKISSVR